VIRLPRVQIWRCTPVSAVARIMLAAWTHNPPLHCDDVAGDTPELKVLSISLADSPLLLCSCIINGDSMTSIEWSLPDPIPTDHRELVMNFIDTIDRHGNELRLEPRRIGFGA
jgi:hypothetical protein